MPPPVSPTLCWCSLPCFCLCYVYGVPWTLSSPDKKLTQQTWNSVQECFWYHQSGWLPFQRFTIQTSRESAHRCNQHKDLLQRSSKDTWLATVGKRQCLQEFMRWFSYAILWDDSKETCVMFCPGHPWETWLGAGHEVTLSVASIPDSQEERRCSA